MLFVAEPCVTEDWSICPIFPSQIGFSEVPMMGFQPIPRFSRERILSPLRLPFRHIGAVKIILAAFCYPTNRDLMGITFAKQCPKRREESVFPVRNSCSRQRDLRPADFGSCLVRLSFSENHPHAGEHETRPEKRPQRKLFAADRPS